MPLRECSQQRRIRGIALIGINDRAIICGLSPKPR
jgi:hypothetical protein